MRSSRVACLLAVATAAAACSTSLLVTDTSDAGAPGDAGATDALPITTDGASDASSDAALDAPGKRRLIFVTAATVRGDMNPGPPGRAGGDTICALEVAAAGLDASVVAWLSEADASAIDRLPDDAIAWALRSGKVVFSNRNHIEQGSTLMAGIVEAADGATIQPALDAGVFTGTAQTGVYNESTCLNWTVANTMYGLTGTFGSTTEWGYGTPVFCSERHHLICFEK